MPLNPGHYEKYRYLSCYTDYYTLCPYVVVKMQIARLKTTVGKQYNELMDPGNETSSQSTRCIRPLLSALTLDWIPVAFKLYQDILQLFKHGSHEGLYEVLEYDAVLDLIDPKGERALFKKRLLVKFLQDNVIAYQDHAWGDGQVLLDYHCSPGTVVDRYQDGDRWNVLISLRETKSAGDMERLNIQRKLERSFTKKEEWWQIEMQNQTKWLKFSILFPGDRRCQRAILCEKTRNRTTILNPQHFADLPDGRQVLTWESKAPKRFETYTIKWRW